MSESRWTVTQEMETAHNTNVFSGGACNILDKDGRLLRNTERDAINDWLTQKGILFFDPQIHPDTHGCEYDYYVHHQLEVAARASARVNMYEVSPRTFGGITSLEIASDHFRWNEPVVIFFSDGKPTRDIIPAHSNKGYPLFVPYGINDSEAAMRAHYKEMIKNANNMRKYILGFAREMHSMTVGFSEHSAKGDIVITPERMHANDLFTAMVKAASNERVYINFTGGEKAQDAKGNPIMVAPERPREAKLRALLDHYVDEGSALRRALQDLIRISVFVRIVYTQKSCIQALEELLKMKRLM